MTGERIDLGILRDKARVKLAWRHDGVDLIDAIELWMHLEAHPLVPEAQRQASIDDLIVELEQDTGAIEAHELAHRPVAIRDSTSLELSCNDLVALASAAAAASVRSLSIHGTRWRLSPDDGGWGASAMHIRKADLLWRLFPRLEQLLLVGDRILLDRIDAPLLRRFEMDAGYRGLEHNVRSIANAHWPALETLVLHHVGEMAWARDILDASGPPSLAHLSLIGCWNLDELCKGIDSARLLPQLKTLDVSGGDLSIAGARALHAHAASLGHLERLTIDGQRLDDEDRALLRDLCRDVRLV